MPGRARKRGRREEAFYTKWVLRDIAKEQWRLEKLEEEAEKGLFFYTGLGGGKRDGVRASRIHTIPSSPPPVCLSAFLGWDLPPPLKMGGTGPTERERERDGFVVSLNKGGKKRFGSVPQEERAVDGFCGRR